MSQKPLTDAELDTLGALRRVGDPAGPVTELGGRYFYRGYPMVPWLEGPLTTLVAAGLITLADPDPAGHGARRATLTEAGYARYHALRTQQLRSPAGLLDSGWLPELPGPGASGVSPDRPQVQPMTPDTALPAVGRLLTARDSQSPGQAHGGL